MVKTGTPRPGGAGFYRGIGDAMDLPDWAKRALEKFRPSPVHGTGEPDTNRMRQWEGFSARFRECWKSLESHKWRVPEQHPRYSIFKINTKYPPADCVRQLILEIAIESAWELGVGKDPQKTTDAVKKLAGLNEEIAKKAGELADLFRDRQQLKDCFHLSDQSMYTEENHPDPFRIFDALELALRHDRFCPWAHVAKADINAFLTSARKPARPKPNWADLLDQASYRTSQSITGRDVGDVAVAGSTTNKTEWSQLALQLIGRLNDSVSHGLPDGFLLGCLTNKQLATLAEVAFNAGGEGTINEDQMRKLKTAYLKRNTKPPDSAYSDTLNRAPKN